MIVISIDDAIARYVADLEERQCSTAHLRTVRWRLGRFARECKNAPLRDAAEHLGDYFRDMRESGLASGTLAGHKQTHLAFWRWCAARRWCSAKSTQVLRSRPNNYSFRPVKSRAANAADFTAVVAALPAFAAHRGWRPRDVRDAALISLVVDSARRRGEIRNLRRSAMAAALERPEATVASGRLVYHVESDGKTGPVSIRFYEETAELLRRWLAYVPASAGFVFISLRTGHRLEADVMRLGLDRICRFAGVKPFGFHAIRKRVVTEVIASTGDAKIGQLLAGHSDVRTTQTYYNDVSESVVDAVAGALADRLRGGGGSGLIESFFGGNFGS